MQIEDLSRGNVSCVLLENVIAVIAPWSATCFRGLRSEVLDREAYAIGNRPHETVESECTYLRTQMYL